MGTSQGPICMSKAPEGFRRVQGWQSITGTHCLAPPPSAHTVPERAPCLGLPYQYRVGLAHALPLTFCTNLSPS